MKLGKFHFNCKRCSTCGKLKPLFLYHRDIRTKDGRTSRCKFCRNVKLEDLKDRTLIRNVSLSKKICVDCGVEYLPSSNRQLRCPACGHEREKLLKRERWHRTYEKKGRAHLVGVNANGYKNGIGLYHKIVAEVSACSRCGSTSHLLVHHLDRNRKNNERSNLEVICKACHQAEHILRDENGRFCGSK